jgi:hypothetical protein
MSFDFGITKSYEQKLKEAQDCVNREGFTDISVKFNHPKLVLQAKPSSKVYLELDLGLITIKNKIEKSSKRLLKEIPGRSTLYIDTYDIQTSETRITKVIKDEKRVDCTTKFKIKILFERCMWFEDLILYYDIDQHDKYNYINNAFIINGSLTPILLQFTQEDYLDLMDVIFFNFANDDFRDPEMYIDDEIPEELLAVNAPTPIDLLMEMDYLGIMAVD